MISSCVVFLASTSPAAHDKYSVTYTQQLRHLRRYHQDNFALIGQIDDQLVDLIFCTYVDTSGRFIQHQYLRLCEKPSAEDNLLLVTTGEVCDHIVRSHTFCMHDLDLIGCCTYHLIIG